MDEKIIFKNGTITINEHFFNVGKHSFAIDSILATQMTEIPPRRRLLGNVAIVGALMLFFDFMFFIIGLITLIGSAVLWNTLKPSYAIMLSTATGEKQAFISTDKNAVEQTLAALQQALLK